MWKSRAKGARAQIKESPLSSYRFEQVRSIFGFLRKMFSKPRINLLAIF